MYRIVCTQCGARMCGENGYQEARGRAENHARYTGHWRKVYLWALGEKGEVLEPVRVIVKPGHWRHLGGRKRTEAACY